MFFYLVALIVSWSSTGCQRRKNGELKATDDLERSRMRSTGGGGDDEKKEEKNKVEKKKERGKAKKSSSESDKKNFVNLS